MPLLSRPACLQAPDKVHMIDKQAALRCGHSAWCASCSLLHCTVVYILHTACMAVNATWCMRLTYLLSTIRCSIVRCRSRKRFIALILASGHPCGVIPGQERGATAGPCAEWTLPVHCALLGAIPAACMSSPASCSHAVCLDRVECKSLVHCALLGAIPAALHVIITCKLFTCCLPGSRGVQVA